MKRAKQRQPRIHPTAILAFGRSLRLAAEAGERCVKELRAFEIELRRGFYALIPMKYREALARSRAEAAIVMARIGSR